MGSPGSGRAGRESAPPAGASPATAKIRVVLVDRETVYRDALGELLEAEPEIDIIGVAGDGLEAVALVEAERPDVVVIGIDLPTMDGIRAASMSTARVPDSRVLLVSDEDEPATLLEALEAGVSGYVTKDHLPDDLITATRAVHRGTLFIPPVMLRPLITLLLQKRSEQEAALRRMSRLTQREREVLALLAEGMNNKEIARILVISPLTVRTHVQGILAKLKVHSRLEAAAFVRHNQLREDLGPALALSVHGRQE